MWTELSLLVLKIVSRSYTCQLFVTFAETLSDDLISFQWFKIDLFFIALARTFRAYIGYFGQKLNYVRSSNCSFLMPIIIIWPIYRDSIMEMLRFKSIREWLDKKLKTIPILKSENKIA